MITTRTKLDYLVVGTGRSGTLYAAKLLTALGFPCGHERVFNGSELSELSDSIDRDCNNSACGKHFGLEFAGCPIAESSYMAVPYLDHEILKDCRIIHVVRDPLKVIRSFLNNLLFFREGRANFRHAQEQFLYEHLPHLELLPDPVSRACFYYLRWNQMIEESIGDRKYLLYPIENGPETVLRFMGIASDRVELPDHSCNAYSKWPDHMRITTNLPAITDEEIQACFLWKEVATLARKYGYSHTWKGSVSLTRAQIAWHSSSVSYFTPAQPDKPLCYPLEPRMVQENFHNFNIIQFKDAFFAIHRELGPVDLTHLSAPEQETLRKKDKLFSEASLFELRVAIQFFIAAQKQAEIQLELLKALDQGRKSLESLYRIEPELVNLHHAIDRTEVRVAQLSPWYRKLAGKLRRGWLEIYSSAKVRFLRTQSSLQAPNGQERLFSKGEGQRLRATTADRA